MSRAVRFLSTSTQKYGFNSRYGSFINGKELIDPNGEVYSLYSPANRDYLCDVVNASETQTNYAIDIAHEAFLGGSWSKSDVRFRAKVLNNIANEIRTALPEILQFEVAQTGRPIKEMRAQVCLLISNVCCCLSIYLFKSYLDCLNGLNILLLWYELMKVFYNCS